MNKLFRRALLISFVALRLPAFAQTTDRSTTPQSPLAKCLPAGIKLSDVVEARNAANINGQPVRSNITVEQKLNDLKATCNKENKLVDGNGKVIVFYHLIGCWGYPPPNYQELLQRQRVEIERLKKEYTVIEMTCNPSGAPIS